MVCDWFCYYSRWNVKQWYTSHPYGEHDWLMLRFEVVVWGGLWWSHYYCDPPHLQHLFFPPLFNKIWWGGTIWLPPFGPFWSLVARPYLVGQVVVELLMLKYSLNYLYWTQESSHIFPPCSFQCIPTIGIH